MLLFSERLGQLERTGIAARQHDGVEGGKGKRRRREGRLQPRPPSVPPPGWLVPPRSPPEDSQGLWQSEGAESEASIATSEQRREHHEQAFASDSESTYDSGNETLYPL